MVDDSGTESRQITLHDILGAILSADAQKIGEAIKDHGKNWKSHVNPDILTRQVQFGILSEVARLNERLDKQEKARILVP